MSSHFHHTAILRWKCSHVNDIRSFLLVITLTRNIIILLYSRKDVIPLMLSYCVNLKSIAPCNIKINEQPYTIQIYTFREKCNSQVKT